jgi:hypothetical protein
MPGVDGGRGAYGYSSNPGGYARNDSNYGSYEREQKSSGGRGGVMLGAAGGLAAGAIGGALLANAFGIFVFFPSALLT